MLSFIPNTKFLLYIWNISPKFVCFSFQYANEIAELYHRNTFVGKLSRKLLYEPTTCFDIQKSKDMQSVSWTPIHLPPRINLRILAHRQLYYYLFVYMLLSYAFNFNPIVSLVFLVGLVLFGLLISTLLNPVPLAIKDDWKWDFM